MNKFDQAYKKYISEEEISSVIDSSKDLTDYIVVDNGKFYVDVYDVDEGEPLWEDGEIFTFTYNGKSYRGYAKDTGDEVAAVRLAV
jgi:hypothetical protein